MTKKKEVLVDKITLRLPPSIKNKLAIKAVRNKESVGSYVRQLVFKDLKIEDDWVRWERK